MSEKLIAAGALKGPHGLQGWVKLACKLEDPALLIEAGPCVLANGQEFEATGLKQVGQGLLGVKFKGIDTPEAASALRGMLYLKRAHVPVNDNEVLLGDLVGQPLFGPDGTIAGTIDTLVELPAGPALEVSVPGRKNTALVPLNPEFVTLEVGPKAILTILGLDLLSL